MEGNGFIYGLHRPQREVIQFIVSVAISQCIGICGMEARAMQKELCRSCEVA